ncbi:MAG: DUF4920 domain-containing protein [Proteobacteria bacterium]|nr:MAG: DUF4920 domain-containing protein [Pseudomonadota bacterium]
MNRISLTGGFPVIHLIALASLFSLTAFAAETTPANHQAQHNHAAHPAASAAGKENADGSKSYGKGVTSSAAPLSLKDALKDKDGLKDKEIVVRAEVEQVCQAMGCWLTLQDPKDKSANVRVSFDNYSFFVPKDSAKRIATVQGKLFDKELSAAEARHYAKDAGKSAAEQAKITKPVKQAWFEATGLTLSQR